MATMPTSDAIAKCNWLFFGFLLALDLEELRLIVEVVVVSLM